MGSRHFPDRLSVSEAALQILLPLGTAAFGMTTIGISWHIVAHPTAGPLS
jgi:hypothetical protein